MATSEVTLGSILQAVPQGAESVFPKAEYEARLERLRGSMKERSFDLVLL
jgi:Xaa-Pro dipeptidase